MDCALHILTVAPPSLVYSVCLLQLLLYNIITYLIVFNCRNKTRLRTVYQFKGLFVNLHLHYHWPLSSYLSHLYLYSLHFFSYSISLHAISSFHSSLFITVPRLEINVLRNCIFLGFSVTFPFLVPFTVIGFPQLLVPCNSLLISRTLLGPP